MDTRFKQNFEILSQLNHGDIIDTDNYKGVEFRGLKRKFFLGTHQGITYRFRVESFLEVVEKNKNYEIGNYNEILKLKKGDLFLVIKKDNLILFMFECISENYIVAVNPLSKVATYIDFSFYYGTIDDVNKRIIIDALAGGN